MGLARALRQLGEAENARLADEKAADLQLGQLQDLPLESDQWPGGATRWGLLLARALAPDQARARFDEEFPEAPPERKADFLAGAANTMLNFHLHPVEAATLVAEALALDSRCAPAVELKAWMRKYDGDIDGALEFLWTWGECLGSRRYANENVISVLFEAGRLDELIELLERDEASHPEEAEHLHEYGAQYRAYLPLRERIGDYERGIWKPGSPEEHVRLVGLLTGLNRPRLVVQVVDEALVLGPPEEGTTLGIANWPVVLRMNGVSGAARLAGDSSLGPEERSRWRRRAATWLEEYVRLLPQQDRFMKVYEADRRAFRFPNDWYGCDLASIRDEEAMANAPEEDKEACRRAWAAYRAYFDRVR